MRKFFREYLVVLGDSYRRLPWILVFLLGAAALDIAGLGLIVPVILAILSGGTGAVAHSPIFEWIPRESLTNPVTISWIAFATIIVYLARALAGYHLHKNITRFSELHRGKLMTRLMSSYLSKRYEFFLLKNSSDLINNVLVQTGMFASGILTASLRLAADAITMLAILVFLAYANWQMVLAVVLILVFVLGLFNLIVRHRLSQLGADYGAAADRVIRAVNHGIGGIREVRVLGIEQHSLRELDHHARALAITMSVSGALQIIPRYLIETSLIGLILLLGLLSVWNLIDSQVLIPELALFGVAALRLMPGATSVVGALNTLRYSRNSLHRLAEDLTLIQTEEVDRSRQLTANNIPTKKVEAALSEILVVRLERVTYCYPNVSEPAVRDISLEIRKGQAIGLIGRSGAGKSTVADILLGLLQPQAGQVTVNGVDIRTNLRSWMNRLAYIPQTVFIADDSLLSNIAFGVAPHLVDRKQLDYAVSASQLDEVITGLPKGIDAVLGERGVRLSGGQRQRVALARALYHNRQLIVMDEATSALDTETEREVVRAIRTLHGELTLVIVAHRVTTLQGCDVIWRLDQGRLAERLEYGQLLERERHNKPKEQNRDVGNF